MDRGYYIEKINFYENMLDDTMNQVLAILVACAQQMKTVIEKTGNYLADILEEFVSVDKTWAAKLNLGDYLK